MRNALLSLVPLLLRLLAFLSLSTLRKCGDFYGKCLYWLNTRAARSTRVNIALCYSGLSADEQIDLVRKSLSETGRTVFESAALWNWKLSKLENLIVEFEGREMLQELLKHSSVVGLTPHWGNWEFLSVVLGKYYSAISLYDARRLGKHAERVKRARERFGLKMVSVSREGLREMLEATTKGELIFLLPDQVPTRGRNVVSSFMGQPARTTTLVQTLASRNELPVVSLTSERVQGGFHVRAERVADQVKDEDLHTAALALNRYIEETIKRNTAQYQWEYKRFRRIPGKDVYQ